MTMKFYIIICLVCFSLTSCTTKKLDHFSTQLTQPNKLDVVRACLDSSRHFYKISNIQSRTSYLEKAYDYYPIENSKGFIPWDFSKDGKLDYIFLEKQKAQYVSKGSVPKIHLVICKSQVKENNVLTYTRYIPEFTLYESILPDFQAESHRIKKLKDTLLINRNYHEHNWGSDSTINIYKYDALAKDFVLVEQEITSNSGDGYRNDIQEVYDYQRGTLTKDTSCGQFTGPCKPGQSRYTFKSRMIKLSEQKDTFSSQVSTKSLQRIINKP